MNTTISFQADAQTRKTLETLAKQQGVSKSVVLRRMLEWQAFLLATKKMQKDLAPRLKELGLETEDDFEEYLG
jgi:Zn-dependent peptidase ImmA (M78 family)